MAISTNDILSRLEASLRSTVTYEPQAVNVGTVTTVGDGVDGGRDGLAVGDPAEPLVTEADEPVPGQRVAGDHRPLRAVVDPHRVERTGLRGQ